MRKRYSRKLVKALTGLLLVIDDNWFMNHGGKNVKVTNMCTLPDALDATEQSTFVIRTWPSEQQHSMSTVAGKSTHVIRTGL